MLGYPFRYCLDIGRGSPHWLHGGGLSMGCLATSLRSNLHVRRFLTSWIIFISIYHLRQPLKCYNISSLVTASSNRLRVRLWCPTLPLIRFAIEEPTNERLPFLDVLVQKVPSGDFKISVYCKETYADVVLHFDSNHPTCHKRSSIKSPKNTTSETPQTTW